MCRCCYWYQFPPLFPPALCLIKGSNKNSSLLPFKRSALALFLFLFVFESYFQTSFGQLCHDPITWFSCGHLGNIRWMGAEEWFKELRFRWLGGQGSSQHHLPPEPLLGIIEGNKNNTKVAWQNVAFFCVCGLIVPKKIQYCICYSWRDCNHVNEHGNDGFNF